MIKIKIFYQHENLVGIECKGHSGYADKGEDIICAAVSVLIQSLKLGCMEVLKLETGFYFSDNSIPLMRIAWKPQECWKTYTLAETTARSLESIADDNPGFVKINRTEDKKYYGIPF